MFWTLQRKLYFKGEGRTALGALARHPGLRLPLVVCLEVKSVGKPDAVVPHVRFDERGWETGPMVTAPILDSTGCAGIFLAESRF